MPPRKTATETVKEKETIKETIHENMRFYGKVQNTPEEARKEIGAGRLKGYTDINPMWRIKKLTEVFGPCGFGWWTQNEKFSFEPCETGEVAVFCELELVVVDPESNEKSQPIKGVGGNKFVANEKSGKYCNDEAMKMAYTDALSIACKSLGFSHDIYFAKDRTKYSMPEEEGSTNGYSAEEINSVISRIQKGIAKLTAEMSSEEKNEFAKNVIAKHIGSENYLGCRDLKKLNALLAELLDLAKKPA